MRLLQLRLQPRSAWCTPWQADTLSGMLCWACARTRGADVLRGEILEPAAAGRPRFVLSDAFPDRWLPVPAALKLRKWPADRRKQLKRARWISKSAFSRFCATGELSFDALRLDDPMREVARLRNTLDRISDTTSGAGGSLFAANETILAEGGGLWVLARVEEGFEATLLELFTELSNVGFGGDTSVGLGQFELAGGLEPVEELGERIEGGNCSVVLSTFQPAADDPTDGAWESFVKFGKLGPDFGLDNVFKRPLLVLKPGACLRTEQARDFVGRAVPMGELLARPIADELRARGAEILHLAFGLSIPARIDWEVSR